MIRRAAAAACAALALAPLWCAPALADDGVLDCRDLAAPPVAGSVGGSVGASVSPVVAGQDDAAAPPQADWTDAPAVSWEPCAGAVETPGEPATEGGYAGYVAEYSDLYNSDGPSREMPGWHDGYLETYYNASAHYLAGEWTLDSDGFYRDSEGRYVVGVDIAEGIELGTVVDTGKGEAVVLDYGSGAKVHDFATAW